MRFLKATLSEGFVVKAAVRSHEVFSDEPVELGGSDSAPAPAELVLSGLASCKLITCKMYAERKMWKLTGMEIELTIEDEEPMVIHKQLRFFGELDDQQIERLKDISGRCPVVRMLNPEYTFRWKV